MRRWAGLLVLMGCVGEIEDGRESVYGFTDLDGNEVTFRSGYYTLDEWDGIPYLNLVLSNSTDVCKHDAWRWWAGGEVWDAEPSVRAETEQWFLDGWADRVPDPWVTLSLSVDVPDEASFGPFSYDAPINFDASAEAQTVFGSSIYALGTPTISGDGEVIDNELYWLAAVIGSLQLTMTDGVVTGTLDTPYRTENGDGFDVYLDFELAACDE